MPSHPLVSLLPYSSTFASRHKTIYWWACCCLHNESGRAVRESSTKRWNETFWINNFRRSFSHLKLFMRPSSSSRMIWFKASFWLPEFPSWIFHRLFMNNLAEASVFWCLNFSSVCTLKAEEGTEKVSRWLFFRALLTALIRCWGRVEGALLLRFYSIQRDVNGF